MPDRESFIAAIAAEPDDDLPRLVFADWLDENGEPERAEFIRVQIRRAAPGLSQQEADALHNAANELFEDHGPKWYGAFLSALGVDVSGYHFPPYTESWRRHRPDGSYISNWGGGNIAVNLRTNAAPHEMHGRFEFHRGFLHHLTLPPAATIPRCSFAAAFRLEPVTTLSIPFAADTTTADWDKRMTDPVLRRVRNLTVTCEHREGAPALPVFDAVFRDAHLAGVRRVELVTDYFGQTPFPPGTLADFGRSPLAYRADEVELIAADGPGVRALCRQREFHWKTLHLHGAVGPHAAAQLADTGLPRSVTELHFYGLNAGDDADLGDGGVAAMTAYHWAKLTELTLRDHGLTSRSLLHLASAPFTTQLEVLDLSGNRQLTADGLAGLRELAAALNPGVLRGLYLRDCGLDGVPDFLVAQFGDRVWV